MKEGAQFELGHENERIALIHGERCGLAGQVCVQARERVSSQEISRVVRAVAIVVALHSRLQCESLVVENQSIPEQEASVRCVGHILGAARRKRIEHVDCSGLCDRVCRVVLLGDLKPGFIDEAHRENCRLTQVQAVLSLRGT